MFEMGLKSLHLRKPGCKAAQLRDFLNQISPKFHPRIILHDHFFLGQHFDTGGIHLNSRKKEFSYIIASHFSLQRKFGCHKSISCSCHSIVEIERLKERFNYAFLSPIFDSISKSGYSAAFSTDSLNLLPIEIKDRIIALGGCDSSKIDFLKKMGVSGAAVLGAVWNRPAPLDQLHQLLKACNE